MLDIFSAVILGIVEGLTEFLPVSSTGHLIIVARAMGLLSEHASSFEVFIQLGAILAVVVLYWRRFLALLDFSSPDPVGVGFRGLNGIIKLGVASFPAFVLGFLFHSYIKEYLFGPTTVAVALIVGGLVMLIIERARPQPSFEKIDDLSFKTCFGIGLFQCFALWPGVSRSGASIVGAMLIGCSRRAAAEFSFLLAVPVMVVATMYDLLKSYASLSSNDLFMFAVGFFTAAITAVAAVKVFIGLLGRYTLRPFGIYRIIVGIVVLILVSRGFFVV